MINFTLGVEGFLLCILPGITACFVLHICFSESYVSL
nr:MAG TPA: hypothetical protein [Caudoviricetes sp.]